MWWRIVSSSFFRCIRKSMEFEVWSGARYLHQTRFLRNSMKVILYILPTIKSSRILTSNHVSQEFNDSHDFSVTFTLTIFFNFFIFCVLKSCIRVLQIRNMEFLLQRVGTSLPSITLLKLKVWCKKMTDLNNSIEAWSILGTPMFMQVCVHFVWVNLTIDFAKRMRRFWLPKSKLDRENICLSWLFFVGHQQ